MTPSKSQIKKAGRQVRRYSRGELPRVRYDEALKLIDEYRSSYVTPLSKVSRGLRSFLATLEIQAEVSQRLKRMDTIVDKLSRESSLGLETMGDIGGCRVVLDDDNLDDLRRVQHWIDHRWGKDVCRRADYVAQPRSSGYRAIHLTVTRDGRMIEIQLRTARMHRWAQLMERLSQAFGENFKRDGVANTTGELGRTLSSVDQLVEKALQKPLSESDHAHLVRLQDELTGILALLKLEGGASDG